MAADPPRPSSSAPSARAGRADPLRWGLVVIPGLALCFAIAVVASGLQWLEALVLGRAWIERLVLAILIGAGLRAVWTPPTLFRPGIALSAGLLLEIAVVLLGASLSAAALASVGPTLLIGIVVMVATALGAGYAIGRRMGLTWRTATLIACGNAICGNSAIAAVAPVIGAESDEVSASIGFTAVLGVVLVLALPLIATAAGLADPQAGVLAGLTVYAVPQVLAATAPMGPVAVDLGTLVKLIRVLMLGPVCLVLALIAGRTLSRGDGAPRTGLKGVPLERLVPWFIIGFLVMMAARSLNLIPVAALEPMATTSAILTLIAMAALGIGADIRAVARAGVRVAGAVSLSLGVLLALALALIYLLDPV